MKEVSEESIYIPDSQQVGGQYFNTLLMYWTVAGFVEFPQLQPPGCYRPPPGKTSSARKKTTIYITTTVGNYCSAYVSTNSHPHLLPE